MPVQDGAPPEAVQAVQEFTQVVIHEPETWTVGSDVIGPAEPPRYVVRVSVPDAWREEMSPVIIAEITRVLAEVDTDPARLYDHAHAWIYVVGMAEGSCGMYGKPMGTTDIVEAITQPYRGSARRTEDLPPGTALDPVCGMAVALESAAQIIDQGDTTYAFCAESCYEVFTREQRAADAPELAT